MRVGLVIGTRPEAIKMAPVVRALKARGGIAPIVISTGQHQQLVETILEFFDIKPDYNLGLMPKSGSLNSLYANIVERLDNLFPELNLDLLVVQGDTTSATAAAHAAFYRKLKVAHVEAGLRTGRLDSPWPEEWHRRVIAVSSNIHFAPTPAARSCLIREGVPTENVIVTGNTVIDALLSVVLRLRTDAALKAQLDVQFDFLAGTEKILLVTIHRRENFGAGVENVCRALKSLARRGDVKIVLPVHPNPNVKAQVLRFLSGLKNIHLIPPADYVEFVYLMERSDLILTDSGGVQEEAPSLNKPVFILRNTTERSEAVAAGVAQLIGTQTEKIVKAVSDFLDGRNTIIRGGANPFGDGRASERIAEFIASGHWRQAPSARLITLPGRKPRRPRFQRVPLQILAGKNTLSTRARGFTVGSGEGAGRA